MSRRPLVALALVALGVLAPRAADAHPLGNLTVNAAVDVIVRVERADVGYTVDLAELPTVPARQDIDTDHDGALSPTEQSAWAAARCASIASKVTIDGRAVAPAAGAPVLTFPDGQGGLPTLRLDCSFTTPLTVDGTARTITVADANDTDRIGWREVVVRGDGVTLTASDAPAVSPSAGLTAYPTASSPSHQREATASVRAGGPLLAGGVTMATPGRPTRGADALTRRMNRLVGDHELSVGVGVLAAVLAFVLGGIHSLAPGHGKTLMAATVLARRGAAARQVLTIGTTVAITHTAGVLVLGTAIWTSQAVAPDRVLPWLSLASGALLVATGVAFAAARLRGGRPLHAHHHGHGHSHHGDHDHQPGQHHEEHHGSHDHGHHAHGQPHSDHDHEHHGHDRDAVDHTRPVTRRWLVTMGVAGGLVPTPSALVVLLGAAALGRTWFGVLLVAVYGVGMASTLLAAGVALVRLQGWLERHWFGSRWLATTLRVAPFVTATALVVAGVTLAVRTLPSV